MCTGEEDRIGRVIAFGKLGFYAFLAGMGSGVSGGWVFTVVM